MCIYMYIYYTHTYIYIYENFRLKVILGNSEGKFQKLKNLTIHLCVVLSLGWEVGVPGHPTI